MVSKTALFGFTCFFFAPFLSYGQETPSCLDVIQRLARPALVEIPIGSYLPSPKNNADSWIGHEVSLSYKDSKGGLRHTEGFVVDSARDGRLWIEHPDQTVTEVTNVVSMRASIESAGAWQQDWLGRVTTVESFMDQIRQYLSYGIDQKVPMFGLVQIREKGLRVHGKLGTETLPGGYNLVTVTDTAGRVHRFDPVAFLDERLALSISKEDANAFRSAHMPGSAVTFLDRSSLEAHHLARLALDKKTLFDLPEFYQFVSREPNRALNLLKTWYGDVPEVARIQNRLGKEYLPLALDPGIISRADEFIEWAQSYIPSHSRASLYEIREAFAKKLGSEVVWRGMLFQSADQADSMKAHGIDSTLLKESHSAADETRIRNRLFHELTTYPMKSTFMHGPRGPLENIRFQILNKKSNTMVSASGYIEPTYSPVWSEAPKPGNKFYLYKLNVPKISVIKKAGPFSFLRNTTGTFVANGVSGKEFRIPYNDLNFEVFIPFRIRPEWVESVTSYDDMPWSKVFHD
ncbi:MAG: hypothetical protein A2428_09090 [Bdellovibrionales bacterium RIFOXYC1_FULL_54_43]|nr:MAG: hypothetical protein A2428_09090 [Bdellovibrionales bacterium RIFOXYC1_FULL_54_43]OFZ83581.1 MAG: hypothetical protein A2603_00405 [Bdellovibrionales bacterium RIFOXYD1_FULL_55_31]